MLRSFSASPSSRIRRNRRARQLACETLEARQLLSNFTVNEYTVDSATTSGSLRWAITQATTAPGTNTVTFDPTVFNVPRTITLTEGQLDLTDANASGSVTVTGPGANLLTVSGNHASQVFDINGGSAALSGLTITGGSTSNSGGGVVNYGGKLSLTNVTVSGNSAQRGGGLYNNSGTVSLSNSIVSGNSASIGGGLFVGQNGGAVSLINTTVSGNSASSGGGLITYGGTVSMTSSTVSDNTAGRGGGLYDNSGTITLTNSTVSGNSASGAYGGLGGGLFIGNDSGAVSLTNCTVSGNSASGQGGGLITYGGTVSLTNSTVSDNSSGRGGGLYDNSGTVSLTNSTVSGNSASGEFGGLGGGLFIGHDGGAVSITNCTVSGNSASGQGGGLIIYGGTVSLTNTIVAGQTAGGDIAGPYSGTNNLIGGVPLLAPLGNYSGPTQTMALLPGSPAIGGGTATGAPTTDQRGVARSGRVDIGAFQSQGFIVTVTSGNDQSTLFGTPFSDRLSVTVSSAFGEPVAGGLVSFTGPGSGASATFSGNPAVIAADGSASVSATANGAAGTYTVTASTGLSSAGFTLTNFAQPAFVSLDAPTITYGTATATLGGTIFAGASVPTGSVNITVNGVTEPAAIDSNGNFSVAFPTATLHATNSPYAITYAYAGNGPFFPVSDSSQVLSVNKATPTLVVTGATATYDGSAHPATFTITGVNGDNLTSLVTLTYAGSANVPVNAGTYAVLASFAGNADYLAVSNSSQSVVIAQAAATISVSPYTVTYDAASHTATGTATGVGGVNLGSDLNLTGTTHPNAGTYSTDAWTFTDATGNYQSASGTVNDVINQATTTTVMTSSVNPSSPGQSVTFTAIVSPVAPGGGTPTGSVTFENGSTVLGTVALSIVEGQAEATLATTFSTLGTFTITATYENTGGNYTASSISLAQTVQVGQTPGVYVFGTTLYVIGANTSDYAAISPAGAKNDGRTGLSVSATLNGVWSLQTFTQTFTAIVIVGFGGNDNFQLAGSLNLPTSVTEGNGNNYVLLGGGNDTISLGDGADYVSAGDGNDNVTVGNGNDNIQLGNGSDVVVEGNGNDYVSAGNGADLVVGGLGQHTIQLGNGNDILIDGSATVINTGDSLWQILSDWNSNSSTSVNTRLKVVYNTTHPNVLKAGSGRDWFFYNAPTTSNKKSTDRLN